MKKTLLFATALIFTGVVAFSQLVVPPNIQPTGHLTLTPLHGSGPNGMWLCHDPGAPKAHCEDFSSPELLQKTKCCWRMPPGDIKGGKSQEKICGEEGTLGMPKCDGKTSLKCCIPKPDKGNRGGKGNKGIKDRPANKVKPAKAVPATSKVTEK